MTDDLGNTLQARRPRRLRVPATFGPFNEEGIAPGSGAGTRGYKMPPSGNRATDAAIGAAQAKQLGTVPEQQRGPITMVDYLNHEFLNRQKQGTPAWEVGTIPNKTYPGVQDKVMIVGPNKLRIVSGLPTQKNAAGELLPSGSRDISTNYQGRILDAHTFVGTMPGFAPNKDYTAAQRAATEKMAPRPAPDQGKIVEMGPTEPPWTGGNTRVAAPTENRYLEKGGVMTPVENLTPQERVKRGAGGFWDTLLHSPASEAVKSWLGSRAPAISPALAANAPMSPGLSAVPEAERGRFVEGGAPFNPAAPVRRAVPVGSAPIGATTAQAARVQSPTNASERPRTETTPMDINKTDLSSQPTPGITGGVNPNAANPAPPEQMTPSYARKREPYLEFA